MSSKILYKTGVAHSTRAILTDSGKIMFQEMVPAKQVPGKKDKPPMAESNYILDSFDCNSEQMSLINECIRNIPDGEVKSNLRKFKKV